MTISNILHAAIDAFKQTFRNMCQNSDILFDELDEKSFEVLTSILMDAACNAGKAGLEQYLSEMDTLCPTIKNNDTTYRYKGTSEKQLLTLFGTITIERAMYYDEQSGGQYHFPLDHALGLEKDDFATLEAREMILFGSSSCVPRELELLLKKCSLCRPSRTAIQNIINRDGEKMELLRDKLSDTVLSEYDVPSHTQAPALVASLDGVNVLLREPGKKKGRKNKRPVIYNDDEQSPTSYHNAMVGSVSLYGKDVKEQPKRLCSIYTARMPQQKSSLFKKDFERMIVAVEQKLCTDTTKEGIIPKVLLTDGHLMIKGFAKESTVLQPFEKLLDFYHATEHLSKAANAMYGEKSDLSQAYYKKWRDRLKVDSGAPESIFRSLKGFQKRNQLSGKRKEELKTEITFFRKNRLLMKYADFIQRGLPIGSGPIEAAAKTIVRQRMCRSGMSWSREKGQYVLTIRAYVHSGLWEKAWKYYKELKQVA